MAEKCPKCGAEKTHHHGNTIGYACGSTQGKDGWTERRVCKDNQIAALKQQLAKATEPITCPACGKNCMETMDGKCHWCWRTIFIEQGKREGLEAAAKWHEEEAARITHAAEDEPNSKIALILARSSVVHRNDAEELRRLAAEGEQEKCETPTIQETFERIRDVAGDTYEGIDSREALLASGPDCLRTSDCRCAHCVADGGLLESQRRPHVQAIEGEKE